MTNPDQLPETPPDQENSTTPTPTDRWAWLRTFVKENPLVIAWNIVLTGGGILLLIYHLGIDYLPDFSLSDLVGLFASVTLIGLMLIILFTTGGLGSAMVVGQFDIDKKPTHEAGTEPIPLPIDPVLPTDNSTPDKPSVAPIKEHSLKEKLFSGNIDVIALLFLPSIFWMMLSPRLPDLFENYPNVNTAIQVVKWLLLCLLIVIAGTQNNYRKLLLHLTQWSTVIKESGVRFVGWFVWIFMLFPSVLIALLYSSSGTKETGLLVYLVAIAMFNVLNVVAYLHFGNRKIVLPIFAAVMMVCISLPMMSGHPLLWPEAIVRAMSIGHRNAASMVISYKQCQSFAAFQVQCKSSMEKDPQMSLQNVNVLSRVSSSVLIEVMATKNAALITNFPRADVNFHAHMNDVDRLCQSNSSHKNENGQCASCDPLLLERVKKMDVRELPSGAI